MLPSELIKKMTRREYLTLMEHYNEKHGNTTEKTEKKEVTFGPPVYQPLTEAQKARQTWESRIVRAKGTIQ